MQSDCKLSGSSEPPFLREILWSTCLASFPQQAQKGNFASWALRIDAQAAESYQALSDLSRVALLVCRRARSQCWQRPGGTRFRHRPQSRQSASATFILCDVPFLQVLQVVRRFSVEFALALQYLEIFDGARVRCVN